MGLVDVVGVVGAWWVLWVFICKKKVCVLWVRGCLSVYLHIYEEKSMLCASTIQIELLSSPSKVNRVELIPIPQHCPLTNRQILPIY